MPSIKLSGLNFAFPGEPPIFSHINLELSNSLVGIVGPNGTGKSTLLRLISGEIFPAGGIVSHTGTLACLDQQNPPEKDPRSGGEWMRARLEDFLALPASVFLLDEPSHHLDAKGRTWLFQHLTQLRLSGRLILVASHDGELLDLCSSFIHLHPPRISAHGGPYSKFLTDLSAERERIENEAKVALRSTRGAERNARAELERQTRRMETGKRNAPDLGLSALALGLRKRNAEKTAGKIQTKQAQKVDLASARHKESKAKFNEFMNEKRTWNFSAPHVKKRAVARALVTLSDTNVFLKENALWREPLNFTVRSGERIRLMGPNGSGKSTLLDLISEGRNPNCGEIHRTQCDIVFIRQSEDEDEIESTLLEFARERFDGESEGRLRERLAAYGFRGDAVFRKLAELSGGERVRARLVTIALAAETCDILLLDEPSNHLDALAKDSLFEMLSSFLGALILVTHDETFASRFDWSDTWSLPG